MERRQQSWRSKTDHLASRAKTRYREAGLAAESAERQHEERIRLGGQFKMDQGGESKSIAALLSSGTFLDAHKADRIHQVHPTGQTLQPLSLAQLAELRGETPETIAAAAEIGDKVHTMN